MKLSFILATAYLFVSPLSAIYVDHAPIRPLFTPSTHLLFPSNAQPLTVLPRLPEGEAIDLFSIRYIPNPLPTQLSSQDKTYFDHLNRCCTQNCCSRKLTGHTYDGLAGEYGCNNFEDYFCCCCLCCCCEEDYYGEGIGAGAGTGAGYGAGYGAGTGFGSGPGFGGTAGGFDPSPGPGEGPGLVADAGGFDPTPGPSMIIPEPSIYLILVSGLLIAIYAARIKRKKTT